MTGCQQTVKTAKDTQPRQEPPIQEAETSKPTSSDNDATAADLPAELPAELESEPLAEVRVEKMLTPAQRLTQQLIEQGESALTAERLLTPVEDNANLYFQAALGRDPGNYRAIQGISAIVDVYTQWAWQSAQRREYSKAARYIDSARSVNPEDPTIVEMDSRISDLKARRENAARIAIKKRSEPTGSDTDTTEESVVKAGQFRLPETLFSLSEDEIIAQIQPIIDEVSKTNQSLAIYWPNDKEARLIYQIINSRVTEFRVRAMTYHRADYMVELQQD